MRIKKFNEMLFNYDYDYIIKILCSEYKWGNTISSEIQEFEKSDSKLPIDTDDYIQKFNRWLFKKFKGPETFYKDDIIINPHIGWYGKST